MANKTPCYGCEERVTGCHVVCSIGIEYDKKYQEEREAARKENQKNNIIFGHMRDNAERIKKTAHRQVN